MKKNSENFERTRLKGLAWLMQMLSGTALVFLLTYHILITHIFGNLKFTSVLVRIQELWVFYLIFLTFVVFHAFNGLSTIAYEYGLKRLSKVLYIVMVFVIVYGVVLLTMLKRLPYMH